MDALAIGTKMVALINQGPDGEAQFVDEYFADHIVSIEGGGSEDMPARQEGIAAIRGKHDWWYANHTVHGFAAEGPFVGLRSDQFAVQFTVDMTPHGGTRTGMREIALYTVDGGKVVQEEFLYLNG